MSQKTRKQIKPNLYKKDLYCVAIHLNIKTITREFDPGSG